MSRPPKSSPNSSLHSSRLVAVATFLSDYWTQILTGSGTILTVLPPLLPFPGLAIVLLVSVGALLLIWALVRGAKESVARSEWEERQKSLELKELRARETLNTAIEHLAADLSRDVELYNSDVRLTVYAHDSKNRQFVPLARVSDNPEYKRLNRPAYPDHQGYLSEVWKRGEFWGWDQTLYKAKKDALKGNFSEEEYDALPYKIGCFFGRRLDSGNVPVGIIFWESTERKAFEGLDLAAKVQDNPSALVLGSVLSVSRELATSLSALALSQP